MTGTSENGSAPVTPGGARPRSLAARARLGVARAAHRSVVAFDTASGSLLPAGRRGALVLAPARPGSEGDALLVAGVGRLLDPPVRVGTWARSDRWGPIDSDPTALDLLRAATAARPRSTGRRPRAVTALRRWRQTWYLGADVVDGTFHHGAVPELEWIDTVAAAGGVAGVCGFSISESPHPEAIARMRAMDTAAVFVARGEISAARFRDAVGRPCHVFPDLSWALLTEEYALLADAPVLATGSAPTIGLNLSAQVAALAGMEALLDAVSSMADQQRRRGATLTFVPHDERGTRSDIALLGDLAARLGVPGDPTGFTRGLGLRERIRRCDLIVTGRMHLAISALAFGVPVVAYAYNGKFEDLAADPDLGPWLRILDPHAGDLTHALGAAVDDLAPRGRMPAEELHALHQRKRAALAAYARVLASGSLPDRIELL